MAKKKNVIRADGRIAVQVYLGMVDGKRKYKTVYGKTQKEADEAALRLKVQMKKGIDIAADHNTFKDWADRWLEIKQRNVGGKQYRCYKTSATYLTDYLGPFQINKITTMDLWSIAQSLADKNPHTQKPSSKKVLLDLKNSAKQIFDLAISNRVLEYNPAVSLSLPSTIPSKKRRSLSDVELARIIDTPHRARRAAMIMAYSGLRRGELIPLTYNDIDLNAHTIRVNKSVAMVNGKPVVKSYTKTEAGMRVVTIPQLLVDFLNQDFNGEYVPNDLVCPGKANCLMTESAFDRMWESYLVDLNLKYGDFSNLKYRPKSKFDPRGVPMQITPFTPHCLRHTFASLLYKAGVDVLTAKDQLGHEDVKTTLQIYTHLDKIYKEKRMNKLDDYLKDASQMQVR